MWLGRLPRRMMARRRKLLLILRRSLNHPEQLPHPRETHPHLHPSHGLLRHSRLAELRMPCPSSQTWDLNRLHELIRTDLPRELVRRDMMVASVVLLPKITADSSPLTRLAFQPHDQEKSRPDVGAAQDHQNVITLSTGVAIMLALMIAWCPGRPHKTFACQKEIPGMVLQGVMRAHPCTHLVVQSSEVMPEVMLEAILTERLQCHRLHHLTDREDQNVVGRPLV